MTIEERLRRFLLKFVVSAGITLDDDLVLSIEEDSLVVVVANLKPILIANEAAVAVLGTIERLIYDIEIDSNVNDYVRLRHVEIKYLSRQKDTKYRVRKFAHSADVGAIIPVTYFTERLEYGSVGVDLNVIEKSVREIILFQGDDSVVQEEFTKFWKSVLNPQVNTVFAAFFNTAITFVELYSKLYFLYLIGGRKTMLPQNLMYSYIEPTALVASIESETKDFTQFFEVYDVIDEYHHTQDILMKYLKLYQVIEYLITRALLVKIQQNDSNENLFLREINSFSKFDDFDKKNFVKVFASEKTTLTSWFTKVLKKNPKVKVAVERILYPNEQKTIDHSNAGEVFNAFTGLIYKLRNSIVHNKESEIHLTLHNIQLNVELIKFIKELLKELEGLVFEKVASFDYQITYTSKFLRVY